jgi:hypothetical protein
MVRALGDGDGRPRCLPRAAAPPKLLIVDLIAKHDIQADEELAREGDFGLGPPASMQDGEVTAPKLVVGARGLGGRLAQHPRQPPAGESTSGAQDGVRLGWWRGLSS